MILGQWGTLGFFGEESPPAVLPIAKARVIPSSVIRGGEFTLDATNSQNADSYLWEQLEGGEVSISSPTSEISTQVAPSDNKPDKLRFRLTVTNEVGIDSAETFVNVRPRLKAKKVIRVI